MTGSSARTTFGALVLPVLAGLSVMAWLGAPQAYLAINAAALLLARICAALVPTPGREGEAALLIAALLAVFWATMLVGTEQDGVHRWLRAGPVTLHAGYLVLPLLAVLLPRIEIKLAAGVVCLLAIAAALQPDAAVALGVAGLALVLALQQRQLASTAACLLAIALGAVTVRHGDRLSPVAFVEFVPQQAWSVAYIAGTALIGVQVISLAAIARRGSGALGLAAFLLGCTVMSWLAPFPSLLIGYGAAPIIGLGLALAALR